MHICIYTKKQFEDAAGEHILQNFLGARWTDSTIMCNSIQQLFGETIDREFSRSLDGFRTVLGTKGGRGGPPPPIKNVQDQKGNIYHLTAGGQAEIAKPIVQVDYRKDGSADVQITLGHQGHLGWALNILKKEHPNLDIGQESFAEDSKKETNYLDSPIKLSFGIGGQDFFRGACKALFNLLGVHESQIALSPELDKIRQFIVSGTGDSSEFIGWCTQLNPFPLPRLGPHDHFISIWSRDDNITGFIQLFGEIPFVVQLATDVTCNNFCYSYLVNPHRDTTPSEIRNGKFDPSCIPLFSDCPHIPGKEVWAAHKTRLERFLREYQNRAEQNVIESIIHDALGPIDGRVITKEDTDKILEGFMKFIKSKLGVPNE
nr:hypothetical protein [uncultured Desulfuromonas sp.]